MEAIAGLCTHPSRGRASGGRAKSREGPESPGRGTSALGAHPWEVVLVSASVLFGASSSQRLNSPSLRKENNHWVLALDFENKLLFNTKWEKEAPVVVVGWGRKEKGEAPAQGQLGPRALPRRQAAGRDPLAPLRSAPFLGLQCPLSRSRRIAAPAGRARRAPHEACSQRAAGAAPRQPLGHPLSPAIATTNKAEIASAGSPAGIKALSGAVQTGRARTCAARASAGTSGSGRVPALVITGSV